MQWERHKKAKATIETIVRDYNNYFIIHYSCQSFNRVESGKTAIITSIAIYSCASGTTESFDIQTTAERSEIKYDNIEENIEEIERKMLNDFF